MCDLKIDVIKWQLNFGSVQFWSEIILVISNETRAVRSFDFEIKRMISDKIALHSTPITVINQGKYIRSNKTSLGFFMKGIIRPSFYVAPYEA